MMFKHLNFFLALVFLATTAQAFEDVRGMASEDEDVALQQKNFKAAPVAADVSAFIKTWDCTRYSAIKDDYSINWYSLKLEKNGHLVSSSSGNEPWVFSNGQLVKHFVDIELVPNTNPQQVRKIAKSLVAKVTSKGRMIVEGSTSDADLMAKTEAGVAMTGLNAYEYLRCTPQL